MFQFDAFPALSVARAPARETSTTLRALRTTTTILKARSARDVSLSFAGFACAVQFRKRCRHMSATLRNLRVSRKVVVLGENRHSVPVQKWLTDVVIGFGFCPWASPAEEAGNLRIVTSKSTTSKEVLDDLVSEARELWMGARETGDTRAKTTLLVCPHVPAWNKDFRHFHAFYTWHLDGGFALAESLGIKVVPFHPDFALLQRGPETGDFVLVPGPDGEDAEAQVIEKNVGKDEANEYCMAVRFANGEEGLIRHASVMAQPSSQAREEDLCRNFTSRAPRPVLHLLRLPDLIRAEQEAQSLPKKPRWQQRLEKEAAEVEAELEREAMAEAKAAFRDRGRLEKEMSDKVSKRASKKPYRKRTTQDDEDLQEELAQMRGATQAITDRNQFTVKSLGPLRLREIMQNCERTE